MTPPTKFSSETIRFEVSERRAPLKTSHLVATDLRKQILRGGFAEGQRLAPEAELMEALDISRDTLREALRILESQSLLTIRRGRGGGAVVRRPDLSSVGRYITLMLQLRGVTIAQLEEARLVIEPPIAERLAQRCDEGGLDRLHELHDAERAAVGDALTFTDAVARFDQSVMVLAGNRSTAVITALLRSIHAGQVFAAVGAGADTASRLASQVETNHAEFLAMIGRGDESSAKQIWSDHLNSAGRVMVNRQRSRQPIDIVPMWRALGQQSGDAPAGRKASAVAAEIRSRIAEGRLADQDRLPPLPDLAREFAVSRPTLREALRILEMEQLVELRTGDRGGGKIRHPSAAVAVQLAGTIFEARGVTLADFFDTVKLIEPSIVELVASRIGAREVRELRARQEALRDAIDDMPRFAQMYGRYINRVFSATHNPVLEVIGEIFDGVRMGTERAVTEVAALPWVMEAGRIADLFGELIDAFEVRDGERARAVYSANLDISTPYMNVPELGDRLLVDIIE